MNHLEEKLSEHWKKLELYVPIVDRVHGGSHPEFHDVKRVFDTMSQLLKEEPSKTSLTEAFHELRVITSDYTVPNDVCESYEAVYHMLKDLDEAYQA